MRSPAVARAVAVEKLRLVLQDYKPDPIPVRLVQAGQAIPPLKLRRFTEFAASRLRKSLAADLAKLSAPKTSTGKKK
jgi:hypothetical protein